MNEKVELEINRHMYRALAALADRTENVDIATIIRRGIMQQLGLNKDAVAIWEAETREEVVKFMNEGPSFGGVYLTPAAAEIILRDIQVYEEDVEEARGLKQDIDELKEAMEQLKEKFGDGVS